MGNRRSFLTPERIAQLDQLGIVWETRDYRWELNYQAAEAYYRKHGNLNIPADYVSEDGLRIGTWVRRQRKRYHGTVAGTLLTQEQIHQLECIGMSWQDAYARQWE